jgi:hypothetical protein
LHNAISLLSSLTLSLISWGSLLRGKPFTLEYAKIKVPQKYWDSFLFLRVNSIMTSFFGVVFSLEVGVKILRLLRPDLLPYSVFFYVLHLCLFLFIPWFPRWYKARFTAKLLPISDAELPD